MVLLALQVIQRLNQFGAAADYSFAICGWGQLVKDPLSPRFITLFNEGAPLRLRERIWFGLLRLWSALLAQHPARLTRLFR